MRNKIAAVIAAAAISAGVGAGIAACGSTSASDGPLSTVVPPPSSSSSSSVAPSTHSSTSDQASQIDAWYQANGSRVLYVFSHNLPSDPSANIEDQLQLVGASSTPPVDPADWQGAIHYYALAITDFQNGQYSAAYADATQAQVLLHSWMSTAQEIDQNIKL